MEYLLEGIFTVILRNIILTFPLLLVCTLHAQSNEEFGRGLILDDPLFESSPISAPLMRGDYSNLPSAASIKQYAPSPGYQGSYGTCTGWATAYSGRTILEAIKHRIKKEQINDSAFSPSFIYNQIRSGSDCSTGASLIEALNCLRNNGDMKLKDFGYDCSKDVTEEDRQKAIPYRILEYREIANRNTQYKHKYLKKSLAESKPVVLAIDCPNSFNRAKELWIPDSSDYKEWGRGHAIAAVSYDDNKFGGAIELMNSWGSQWANKGFTWIRYKDFDYFCKFAFEMIDQAKNDASAADLSGTLIFKESNGKEMKAKFNGNYFVMEKTYASNTLFELRISNNEPAYVYAFSSDITNKTYKIFPFNDRMVAYLPYRQNNIAIPDEENFNMLDTVKGSSYYCFIYSKKNLNIDSIMTTVENTIGPFNERIMKVLSDIMVNKNDIDFGYKDGINFNAKSNGKVLVPVIIEIKHL
ncbi:MAG: C1 family peptidase [Clostridiales bacterium]